MFDGKAFGEEMVGIVRGYVDRAVAPIVAENKALAERVAELEAREVKVDLPDFDALVAAEVAKLPPAEPGKSVELDDVAPMIKEAVAKAVAAIPPVEPPAAPEPIAPDMDAINATIDALVTEKVAAIPAGKDGQSITADDVRPMLADLVKSAVEAIPAPKDGVGVAGAIIDRDGELTLTLTDGSTRQLGCVVGRDGKDGQNGADGKDGEKGEPGRDGFSLSDFDVETVDERTIKLIFDGGDTRYGVELELPIPVYKHVWKEGDYSRGDVVTFGGSAWHCNVAGTKEKPGSGSDDWSLFVRKGRDAKPSEPVKL